MAWMKIFRKATGMEMRDIENHDQELMNRETGQKYRIKAGCRVMSYATRMEPLRGPRVYAISRQSTERI